MPAFKSTNGFALVEGAAIARYREYEIIMIGPSVKLIVIIHMQSLLSHQNLTSSKVS